MNAPRYKRRGVSIYRDSRTEMLFSFREIVAILIDVGTYPKEKEREREGGIISTRRTFHQFPYRHWRTVTARQPKYCSGSVAGESGATLIYAICRSYYRSVRKIQHCGPSENSAQTPIAHIIRQKYRQLRRYGNKDLPENSRTIGHSSKQVMIASSQLVSCRVIRWKRR